MQNYNYIVLSPQKQHKKPQVKDDSLIDAENLKFQIQGTEPSPVGNVAEKPKTGAQATKAAGAATKD